MAAGEGVTLLDVSRGSENGGDSIITEAILNNVLAPSGLRALRVSTHRHPGFRGLGRLRRSRKIIAGGSNLLASHMERHRQWLVTPDLVLALRGRVVLCGVGWWQYQDEPCRYSRWLLQQILDRRALHSVRDDYTAEKLSRLGYRVVNTNCPSMWQLRTQRQDECSPSVVVTTVTDYNRNIVRDDGMLSALSGLYEQVRIVPMAPMDVDYLAELRLPDNVVICGVGLHSLDGALSDPADYVGTRLHGGIRALQKGRRAAIVAIDNRAQEIARDTGLVIIPSDDLSRESVRRTLSDGYPWTPHLRTEATKLWLQEFQRSIS